MEREEKLNAGPFCLQIIHGTPNGYILKIVPLELRETDPLILKGELEGINANLADILKILSGAV